ncbi:hypothetical protein HELRODRAFT_146520, partial [Helobdella robusta]|uniref:EF-hand domain-containing protein n=1 Tax=Helobdella robusta TaxID=6412 RepID=T1EJS8_HELRO
VWLMVMDRRRKLQDVIDNLNEVEEMKNFNPDEWMEEFLSWMNRNTSKILTSFRKYDRNITNHVSRKDFVDAILKTGMPTSYLKVEAVADLLEKNEQINYKEFVNCL